MSEFMRLFVIFDLPTKTKKEKILYYRFRRFLLNDGYIMLQYSVYIRVCNNLDNIKKHQQRLNKHIPSKGHVRSLIITERQFMKMQIHVGKIIKNENNQPSLFDLI